MHPLILLPLLSFFTTLKDISLVGFGTVTTIFPPMKSTSNPSSLFVPPAPVISIAIDKLSFVICDGAVIPSAFTVSTILEFSNFVTPSGALSSTK